MGKKKSQKRELNFKMRKFLDYIIDYIFLYKRPCGSNKKIEINGNKRVSDETVKIYGGIELNKDYAEKDLDQILKDLYSTNFFEDINVDLRNNVLRINLKEYPIINQLIIIGEPSKRYKDQIKKIIQLKEKRPFIRSYLAKDIDKIKELYSSIGYNSSIIETKIKQVDENTLDMIVEINRANKQKFHR